MFHWLHDSSTIVLMLQTVTIISRPSYDRRTTVFLLVLLTAASSAGSSASKSKSESDAVSTDGSGCVDPIGRPVSNSLLNSQKIFDNGV
jgi:hypothetical protein